MNNILLYLDEFSRVIMKTQQHQKYPFNFESPFIKRFFGDDKLKGVPYSEFTQLLEVSRWCIMKHIDNFPYYIKLRNVLLVMFFQHQHASVDHAVGMTTLWSSLASQSLSMGLLA